MKSRKILAPFNPARPDKRIDGFLCPFVDGTGAVSLIEANSRQRWETGMVVFVGQEISSDDFFAKVVDAGVQICSVSAYLDRIDDYLRQVSTYKIGDIVLVQSFEDEFKLIKLARPHSGKTKLPK